MLAVAGSAPVRAAAASGPSELFSYPDFSTVSGLQLNGTAQQATGNVLSLTRPVPGGAGSVFGTQQVDLTQSFSTSFVFNLSNGSSPPADGITFTVQGSSGGATALGQSGGGLGVMGLSPAAWVEFDTWYNGGIDINANHVAVLTSANATETSTSAVDPGFALYGGGPVHAWVTYDATAQTLSVWASLTPTQPPAPLVNIPINLAQLVGASAFVGFTGATGAYDAEQDLVSWQFTGAAAIQTTETSVVFVHGINGNFRAVQNAAASGDPTEWGDLVQPVNANSNLSIFPYYQDVGYSLSGSSNQSCDPAQPGPVTALSSNLYVDPNKPPFLGVESSSYCDSQSALALDAQALDQLVQTSHANVLVANSMGGAITRGWLAYAQHNDPNDTSVEMRDLQDVIFLQGAQEGSWIAAGGEGVQHALSEAGNAPLVGPVVDFLDRALISKIGFDPRRPGVVDLVPASDWYQSVNPDLYPVSVNYYNVVTDEQAQVETCVLLFCSRTGTAHFGDTVLLPGADDPSAMPSGGGSRFLPPSTVLTAGYARYEYTIGHLYTFSLASVITASAAPTLIEDPASHFNFGSNVNELTVQSCNSQQQVTVTTLVLHVVQGRC